MAGGGGKIDVLAADFLQYLHYNPKTKERGLGKTPCLDYIDYIVSNRKNPSSFHDIFITRELLSSLPTITEKHYIDMHDISGKKTFETMQDLSHKFGFELVKNRKFFERKVYNNLYSLLPCHIDVSLENMHIKLTLTFESNHVNITSMMMPQSYQNNPKLEMIQVDVKTPKDANLVAKNLAVCRAKLLKILDVFLQIPAIKQAHAVSEHDVLDYLKAHPIIAKDLKEILDDDLCDIKRERPDIVQTWTHYHAFEELSRLL